MSPVYNAAYSQTSVYMRGKEQAEKELEERNRIPDSYYENLKTKYNV